MTVLKGFELEYTVDENMLRKKNKSARQFFKEDKSRNNLIIVNI